MQKPWSFGNNVTKVPSERPRPTSRTRITLGLIFCGLTILSFVGCAAVIVKPVPEGDNKALEGIRFYRPTPYLVVSAGSSDAKPVSSGGASSVSEPLHFSIVWMPDLSQQFVIQARPGIGSVAYNPTLENGWNLTGLNASADSKTAEVLTALAGFVPRASIRPAGPGAALVKPGMYRLLFQTDPHQPNYGQLKGVDFEHPVFTLQ